MKKLVVLSILVLSTLSSLSCTKKVQDNTVIFGVMSSMDYLPLAAAIEQGYLDESGVKLNIKKFFSAGERDAAFQSGNIDGTVIDYTGAVLQKAGGIELKLVSACDAPFYIVAGKSTGISDIAGLKGKKVAVSQNTVIDYCTDKALARAGLLPSDIEKVEINRIPVRFEMLDNGKIDATALPEPFASKARGTGNKIITSNSELGFAITGIMFTDKALKEKRELIKKLYIAYNKGAQYIRTHSTEEIKTVLIDEMGFAESDLEGALIPLYNDARPPSDDDLISVAEWLIGRGLIDSGFDPKSLAAEGILPE
ncbi:MAG: ABC transporter substrate-binding protein [Deferribacteraceae bacterium]|jgi:NitT/TauT family transport system substrate-binding protein|nr:ABC transporter substrate-binding protein [Deferribacteraceae bacterium]